MGVVAAAVGAKSRQIAVALQLFGNAATTTSTSRETPAVTESISADARNTWEFFKKILKELVPNIFAAMTTQVASLCLQDQGLWKDACGGRLLLARGPNAARIYEQAVDFALPAEQWSCLKGLTTSLSMQSDSFDGLQQKYSRAVTTGSLAPKPITTGAAPGLWQQPSWQIS